MSTVQQKAAERLLEELSNALQVAVLLSAVLERRLIDSCWARDSRDLVTALERAARTAGDLRHWAQDPPLAAESPRSQPPEKSDGPGGAPTTSRPPDA